MNAISTKKVTKKDDYHHGDLRNVLIQTAKKILTEEGIDRLTLRYCTQKAGVSHSALSHHFTNLDGLLSSVAASGFIDLAEEIKKNLAINNKEDSVKIFFRTYIHFALNNSGLYRAMFSPKVGLGATDYIESNQLCFSILLEEVAKQKRKRGKLPSQIVAFRLWAIAHGFLLMALHERVQIVLSNKVVEKEMLPELYFEFLMKGL